MICYKDMTFCAARCRTTQCKRNQVNIPDPCPLPVAMADLRTRCPDYRPERKPK